MSSRIPHVRPGEPISAAEQNALVDQANAAVRPSLGGPLVGGSGQTGARAGLRDLRRIAVWELTGPMERVLTEGVKDDAPSAPAMPVWYFNVDGNPPENRYADATDATRSVRVYHVHAFPGDQRDAIVALDSGQPGELGIPKFNAGDRVYAEMNNQSGRWEILGPAEDLWRFELKTALVPNGLRDVPSTAQAYLIVYDAALAKYVKTSVEFAVADFLDIWEGDPGCRGYAKRLADSHLSVGWEVLVLETDLLPCVKPSSSSSSGPSGSAEGSSGSGSGGSSGLESSAPGSSGETSSSGEPSSGPSSSGSSSGPPASGSGPPGATTTVDVVVCDPYRSGEYLCFPQRRLSFSDGLLVGVEDLPDTCVPCCTGDVSGSADSNDSSYSSGDSGPSGSGSGPSSGESPSGESSGAEPSAEESSSE